MGVMVDSTSRTLPSCSQADDIFGILPLGGQPRQLQGIAGQVGKAVDFFTLIVMTKDHAAAAKALLGGFYARFDGVVFQFIQRFQCDRGVLEHVGLSSNDSLNGGSLSSILVP